MGDPVTTAALIAAIGQIGGGALGGLMAPEGQELSSFEGVPGIDPGQMMGETKNALSDFLEAMLGHAASPVEMQTTVNPLPAFVGGALPSAIAAPGLDMARWNPGMRSLPGVNIPRPNFSRHSGEMGDGRDRVPPPRGPAQPRPNPGQPSPGEGPTNPPDRPPDEDGRVRFPPGETPAPSPAPPPDGGGEARPRVDGERVGEEGGDQEAAMEVLQMLLDQSGQGGEGGNPQLSRQMPRTMMGRRSLP